MGLYTVDAGEVYGCDRLMFAYVPQGNQLMSGSIRDIITFSDKNRTGDEAGIHRALQIACADGFIAELEQGIDTLLGARGLGLSESQGLFIPTDRYFFWTKLQVHWMPGQKKQCLRTFAA